MNEMEDDKHTNTLAGIAFKYSYVSFMKSHVQSERSYLLVLLLLFLFVYNDSKAVCSFFFIYSKPIGFWTFCIASVKFYGVHVYISTINVLCMWEYVESIVLYTLRDDLTTVDLLLICKKKNQTIFSLNWIQKRWKTAVQYELKIYIWMHGKYISMLYLSLANFSLPKHT